MCFPEVFLIGRGEPPLLALACDGHMPKERKTPSYVDLNGALNPRNVSIAFGSNNLHNTRIPRPTRRPRRAPITYVIPGSRSAWNEPRREKRP